ncbi:RICIN domain-containing protein [Kitasatospora sp. NPDC059577]|uniref:RICIN domain-containing protein n=1 Tax=Kitasatospora sp. NPDC059577 TaxID=3346873 RepID=UPI00368A6E7F
MKKKKLAGTLMAGAALAATVTMATPADAVVQQGWAHVLNLGTGQYLDDYAHNTSQGAPVYTYAQTGQSNQWWWVANNDGNTVTFSSYETQQSGGLGAWWYRNLTRDSGNGGVLGPQQRWGAGIGFGTLPGEERWWYANGDAGTYIHSNAWNGDCLTAHAGNQVTVEGCRTGDHTQQWVISYS